MEDAVTQVNVVNALRLAGTRRLDRRTGNGRCALTKPPNTLQATEQTVSQRATKTTGIFIRFFTTHLNLEEPIHYE